MDEDTETKGILDKTQDEITLRDSLKVTAVVMGASLVIGAVFGAGTTWLENRRERKHQENLLGLKNIQVIEVD